MHIYVWIFNLPAYTLYIHLCKNVTYITQTDDHHDVLKIKNLQKNHTCAETFIFMSI